jgi:mannosyltransferase
MKTRVNFDGKIFEKQSHGGITRVFVQLLRELSEFPEIDAILHLKSNVEPPDIPKSIKVASKPDTLNFRPARVFAKLNNYLTERTIRRHYRSNGSGIFHSTYYSVSPDPMLKQVFTLHDMIFEDYPEYFPNELARKRHINEKTKCIEQADVIVCVSEYTKTRLEAHHPAAIAEKRVEVIHLAAFEPAHELHEDENVINTFSQYDPYILHVGTRHRHKNFNRLLMAMRHPELSSLNLLSVGGGQLSDSERRQILENDIGTRVHVIPRISDLELSRAYSTSPVVAVPSIAEGFGLPLLEALQFGCSVACSNGGSLPEVGGDAPIYFDPFNVEEMALAIAKAYSLRGSAAQRNLVVKRAAEFSWKKCASEYVDVYRSVLSVV